MTISSEVRKAGPFNGNDVTTSFPFTFKVFDKADLRVVRTMPSGIEADLVLDSDYSVTLNGDQEASPGGTVTYPISGDPLPTGWKLTAVGDIAALQPTDLTNGGGFYPQVIENMSDRLTMLIQQIEEELGRTVQISVSDDQSGLSLPATSARADKVLGFDSEGNFRLYDTSVSVIATLYRKFTPTAGQTTFTLPQAYTPGANALYVFRNGSKLVSGADFTETSTTSFDLLVGAAETDVIEAFAGVPQSDLPETDAAAVRYTPLVGPATNVDARLKAYEADGGADYFGFIQAGTGAVGRTAQNKMREVVSVKDFGAVGDGATDDTSAFQAAAAASKNVYVPPGVYQLSGTVVISKDGAHWFGDGLSASILRATTNNLPVLTINGGLNGVTIEGLQLTRTPTAISGGDGIKCSTVTIGQATIRRLLVQNQYNGISLGPTDWSEVEKVIVQKCQNTGFLVTNTASDGACQWSFDTCLSQMNGAQGYLVQTQAGPSQVTVGTFKNCATFANSGLGMGFLGSVGVPLQGLRIVGGFIGEDGDHEIYMDTYGDQHLIDGVFIELAGTRTTGPTLGTAASNVGCGVTVTANNGGIQMTGVHANGNSQDGFFLTGTTHFLSNCRATNNGLALGAGRRNGVYSTTGRVIVMGGRLGNTGGGTSQQYGVFVDDGNNVSIGFADLTGNSVAAWGATSALNYVTSIGNLPNTLNVGLSPAGAVLVGGASTGGFVAAGTINVAGGLLKNNTAYTNP